LNARVRRSRRRAGYEHRVNEVTAFGLHAARVASGCARHVIDRNLFVSA
jgi:hypothetical protein